MSTSLRKSTYPLIKQGLSDQEVSSRLGCCLKTVCDHRKEIVESELPPSEHDWVAIQSFHDDGNGSTACRRHFQLSSTTWNRAIKHGFLKTRPRNRSKRKQPIKIGMVFAHLTVEGGGQREGRRVLPWKCRCVCGNETEASTMSLNSLHKRSCGCLRNPIGSAHSRWKGFGEIGASFWDNIMNNAHARNYPFDYTIEEGWQLFLDQNRCCALSGVPLRMSVERGNQKARTASLDRIDSTKGYIKGNVQWVHKDVNNMKLNHSHNDFIKWIDIIYHFQHKTQS